MTIERILANSSAGPLLGGLSWRPPAGGKHTMRRLHEARNLTTDATHYALLSTHQTVVYGLFQPRASEESIRLAKGAQAAAHCFATQVGAEAPNGALLLTVPADGLRKDERVYVVVLEDGVPVVDSLTTEMEARNALGSEDRPIWSDTPSLYPNCQPVDFEWLARGASKASRMAPIPLNPWPLLMVLVLVGAGFTTWFSVREARRAEAAREQARLVAENDPVPKYLAALAARSKDMVFDRQAWLGAVDEMFDRPAMVPGWRMKSTECNALSLRCETVWARTGARTTNSRPPFRTRPSDCRVSRRVRCRHSMSLTRRRHGASTGCRWALRASTFRPSRRPSARRARCSRSGAPRTCRSRSRRLDCGHGWRPFRRSSSIRKP